MKYQRNVKHARFQFRVRLIRAKHKEQILCCGQSLLRTVDIKAVITDIMVVCMVTVTASIGNTLISLMHCSNCVCSSWSAIVSS